WGRWVRRRPSSTWGLASHSTSRRVSWPWRLSLRGTFTRRGPSPRQRHSEPSSCIFCDMIRSLLLLLAGVGPGPSPRPRLVVVITVDQLRPDYLERYRPQLLGGFATLLKTGASFTDAYQDHAVTETAPGHATILSGRWPAHTGIIRNSVGVQDSTSPLVGVPGPGVTRAVSGNRAVRLAQGGRAGGAGALGVGQGPRGDPADRARQRAGVLVRRGRVRDQPLLCRLAADVGAGVQRRARAVPRRGDAVDPPPSRAGLPRARQRPL